MYEEKLKDEKTKTKFIDEFSEEIYNQTYRFENETIDQTFDRVATDLASVEQDPTYWADKFKWALEDFKFVPGGRIISNAGTGLKSTSYINCFVSGFDGKKQDSMEGIMDALKRQAMILKSEGGYGFCADVMRPRGGYINGIANESPGAVRMLEMWDTQSSVITAGSGKKSKKGKQKIRKGAMMVTMSCSHPDIEEFITAKQTAGRLTKFNMSVLITDEFMNAVKNNLTWNLEFPDYDSNIELYDDEWDGNIKLWKEKGYPVTVYKTYNNANELWDLVLKSTYNRNEPGVLFYDTINRLNNMNYCEHINATNPCIVGDTLIAVADGREYVTIKQLTEEGNDIPVYTLNSDGDLAVKTMRHPRISGYNQKIYKVTIENGHTMRVTGNHRFVLTDGREVEAKDLKFGDSLKVMSKEYKTYDESMNFEPSPLDKNYIWLYNGTKKLYQEHRFLYEQLNNTTLKTGEVVHHLDSNRLNNNISNLELMTREQHDKHHAEEMKGLNNPYHKMDDEWKYKFASKKGFANHTAIHVTNDEIYQHGIKLCKSLNRRFSSNEWEDYASKNNLPKSFTDFRIQQLGTVLEFSNKVSKELGYIGQNIDPRVLTTYNKALENGYKTEIIDGQVFVEKVCEGCGKVYKVTYWGRENAFCGKECVNLYKKRPVLPDSYYDKRREQYLEKSIQTKEQQVKVYSDLQFELGRMPFLKEWENKCKELGVSYRLRSNNAFKSIEEIRELAKSYNHKVVSVEEDGFEDVYNGTVDIYHNYFIGKFEETNQKGSRKVFSINTLNCGEQLLTNGGSCLLGSINLTQFVDTEKQDFNYNKLNDLIPIVVRLMDNVNDKTLLPLEQQYVEMKNKRRIGLGIMGYGSALMMLKIEYGSKNALEVTEKLMNFISNKAYQSSSKIAKEKGSFPALEVDKYLKSNFLKNLNDETKIMIMENGLRNSHLLSIQPTGNTGILSNIISGGLEPVFMPTYTRTTTFPYTPEGLDIPKNIDWDSKKFDSSINWEWIKEGDESLLRTTFEGFVWKYDKNRGLMRETVVKDYAVRYLEERGEWNPKAEWAKTTTELNINQHIDTMQVLSRYIDAAMSKTINIPSNYNYEDFKNVYMRLYDTGTIKGGTTYRAGTMTEVLGTGSSVKLDEGKIKKNNATKRPKSLPCDIYHMNVKGENNQKEEWIVMVGLMNNEPYEIFAFKPKNIKLSKSVKHGNIMKVKSHDKKTQYNLECEGFSIEDISSNFESGSQEALTRQISLSLRHGIEMKWIYEQLDKSIGDIVDFSKAIGRALKKYAFKEGEDVQMKCPECGKKTLIIESGCTRCTSCSYAGCG